MVDLAQMLRDAGTSDVELLGHSMVKLSPNFGANWKETPGPEPVKYVLDADWQSIKAQVTEHVRLHIRGGVHALPGGGEWIETDEQFKFNKRIKQNVMWAVRAGKFDGETLTMRNRRISAARVYAANAFTDGNKAKIERAGRKLARLHFRLWGTEPWKMFQEVLKGNVTDFAIKPDVDHDNARENQQRENRRQAELAYELEIVRIAALDRLKIGPDPGFEDFDAMRAAAVETRDKEIT